MSGILDLLKSDIGKQIISGVAKSTNQNETKTSDVLTMGLPVLTKALQRNASSQKGAESLMNAFSKHDGSILDNLGSLFNGGVNDDVKSDGSKIMGHILGKKQNGIEQIIGQKANLDKSSVGNILKTAAPILMGLIGKQQRKSKIDNSSGLGDLLGNLLGGNSNQSEQNFLEKMLDADGDGSVVDDVANMFLGGNKNKKSGGIGSLIGGLFGKS